jgi:hypothetical protein
MSRRHYPLCRTPMLVTEGIGGQIVVCASGCDRRTIMQALEPAVSPAQLTLQEEGS